MPKRIFDTQEFMKLAADLQSAKNQKELDFVQRRLSSELQGVRIVASFPIHEPYSAPPFSFPSQFSMNYLVPYLCHPNLYFYRHSQLTLAPVQKIDYDVAFDSNVASYVRTVVKNNNIHLLSGDIRQTIDYLLIKNFNFSPFFYFVENIKQVRAMTIQLRRNKLTPSPAEFWGSLNEYFKSNMVCIQLFNNVDCEHYNRTHDLRYAISLEQAEAEAIDFSYNFYVSPEKSNLANDFFLPNQRLELLHLLAVLRIQFSSNRNARDKITEYLRFVQERGIAYLERETVVAFEYFKDRSNVPILGNVNKGCNRKGLLKRIDNIAWDFAAWRFLEKLFSFRGAGDFYVPFFLSFDRRLRDLINLYPIKAVVIDDDSGYVHSVPEIEMKGYFARNGCEDIWSEFSTREKRAQRIAKIVNDDRETLLRIKSEYGKLLHALFG